MRPRCDRDEVLRNCRLAMATAAASEPRRDSEALRRDSEPTTVTVASQATLPPEQRTYGPLLVWGGAAKQTPYLLFRPLRFTLDELWDDSPRPVDCPWELSYQLARTESRLLRTLLHDHGFRPTSSSNYNLCWHNGHVAPSTLLALNEYQKVNHFPNTQQITRKDLMARTLSAMRAIDSP